MKTVGCSLRLTEAKDDELTPWKCQLWINEDHSWTLGRDTSESRLKLGVESGRWQVGLDGTGSKEGVLYIFRADTLVILLELFGVGADFLDRIACGQSMGGAGRRQGPPDSAVLYDLWYGCV